MNQLKNANRPVIRTLTHCDDSIPPPVPNVMLPHNRYPKSIPMIDISRCACTAWGNKCHFVKTKSLSGKFSVVKLTQVRGYEPGILNIYGAVMTSWNTTVFNLANGLATGCLFPVNQSIPQQKPALTCIDIRENGRREPSVFSNALAGRFGRNAFRELNF